MDWAGLICRSAVELDHFCYLLIPARLVYVAESIVSDKGKTSQGRAFSALGRVCLVGAGLFWT
jgi:hypothetical protein